MASRRGACGRGRGLFIGRGELGGAEAGAAADSPSVSNERLGTTVRPTCGAYTAAGGGSGQRGEREHALGRAERCGATAGRAAC